MQSLVKCKKKPHFTHFEPKKKKNTHINGCKSVHKCTTATVSVHIYTITVALAFSILLFFILSTFLSLSLWFDSPPHLGSLYFPMITATQQRRRRRQFSNHQLSTTQLSPLQPKPAEKPIPNPNQNQ